MNIIGYFDIEVDATGSIVIATLGNTLTDTIECFGMHPVSSYADYATRNLHYNLCLSEADLVVRVLSYIVHNKISYVMVMNDGAVDVVEVSRSNDVHYVLSRAIRLRIPYIDFLLYFFLPPKDSISQKYAIMARQCGNGAIKALYASIMHQRYVDMLSCTNRQQRREEGIRRSDYVK